MKQYTVKTFDASFNTISEVDFGSDFDKALDYYNQNESRRELFKNGEHIHLKPYTDWEVSHGFDN